MYHPRLSHVETTLLRLSRNWYVLWYERSAMTEFAKSYRRGTFIGTIGFLPRKGHFSLRHPSPLQLQTANLLIGGKPILIRHGKSQSY